MAEVPRLTRLPADWQCVNPLPLLASTVFVRGKSIGGGDDTRALHDRGELVPMLQKADALKK